MGEVERLDAFERFLVTAPTIGIASHAMGGGGHPSSFLVVLEGGVGALAKMEAVAGDAPAMIRRERAAWVIARKLGWQDMVAATVLRDVSGPGGVVGFASVQVLWPANDVGAPEGSFPEEDQWRAGIFDALTRATDRSPANWLSVPRAGEGVQRLKLIDHGHAFDLARPVVSPFYMSRRGQDIPPEYLEALEGVSLDGLEELLLDAEYGGLESRLEMLVAGVLDIQEP